LDNIGYQQGKFYILDPDTIYKIKVKPPKWLKLWMDKGFDWEESIDAFVDHDFINWTYDL